MAPSASSHQVSSLPFADLSPSLSRDPRKHIPKPRISLPSSFPGPFSIKPVVSQAKSRLRIGPSGSKCKLRLYPIRLTKCCIDQGLNGSFRPASISAGNQIAVDGCVDASPILSSKSDAASEDDSPVEAKAQEETISSVMADVANLVKLVDSRDIVELELKHFDYELVIRKKEALAPPPTPPNFAPSQFVAQPPYPTYALNPQPVPSSPTSVSTPDTPPASQAPASAPASKSDLPQLLSPMAGTFYKCPAPGEPPFVKVGDKVQKGQVICIIEAMKLMNEIEADRTGTIVEIIAEDGKPVSVDTPLFAIKP